MKAGTASADLGIVRMNRTTRIVIEGEFGRDASIHICRRDNIVRHWGGWVNWETVVTLGISKPQPRLFWRSAGGHGVAFGNGSFDSNFPNSDQNDYMARLVNGR